MVCHWKQVPGEPTAGLSGVKVKVPDGWEMWWAEIRTATGIQQWRVWQTDGYRIGIENNGIGAWSRQFRNRNSSKLGVMWKDKGRILRIASTKVGRRVHDQKIANGRLERHPNSSEGGGHTFRRQKTFRMRSTMVKNHKINEVNSLYMVF